MKFYVDADEVVDARICGEVGAKEFMGDEQFSELRAPVAQVVDRNHIVAARTADSIERGA